MRNINPLKNCKQLRRFIGMIEYYRDMWRGHSQLLTPLAELTSKELKFKWNDQQQKIFNAVKIIIGREVLLYYPDFNITFEIHTDASSTQLGAVISQRVNTITFYSIKLNIDQLNYTMTEREIL